MAFEAERAARPVILRRASQRADTSGEKRHRQRLTGEGAHRRAFEVDHARRARWAGRRQRPQIVVQGPTKDGHTPSGRHTSGTQIDASFR